MNKLEIGDKVLHYTTLRKGVVEEVKERNKYYIKWDEPAGNGQQHSTLKRESLIKTL